MGSPLGRHGPVEGAASSPDQCVATTSGDFHIAAIELTGGVMHPIELLKLEGLTHLRELYLPGPIWNPGGGNENKAGVFKALATLTNVERLAFGWHYNAQIEVGDKEIAALATWTNLKELRCSQCSLSKLSLAPLHQTPGSGPQLQSLHR